MACIQHTGLFGAATEGQIETNAGKVRVAAPTWAGLASVDATHRLRAWPQIIDLSGMLRRRDIYSAIIAQAKALGHTIAVFRDGSRE